eukprot:2217968-Pleurochrysis_carterae.AAC.2
MSSCVVDKGCARAASSKGGAEWSSAPAQLRLSLLVYVTGTAIMGISLSRFYGAPVGSGY